MVCKQHSHGDLRLAHNGTVDPRFGHLPRYAWQRHYQHATADIILSYTPPERAGAVVAMRPAFGKIGYTIRPTIYLLLLNVFFREEWFADAEARGLTDQQAQQALKAPCKTLMIGS